MEEYLLMLGYCSALLLNLSDINRKCAYSNTVFPTQKEMDRVGVEPTTSAMSAVDRKKLVQI
jgi:hypothetical protein